MKQTTIHFIRPAMLAVAVVITAVACRQEPLRAPANVLATDAFANFQAVDRSVEKPGHYIKASERLPIPAAVALPGGSIRIATHYAEGVQQYKAQEIAGLPGLYQWVFAGPQADLYERNNKQIGTHGAGPHWTLSPADSIFGQHFVPARTAPSPDAGSIDWLLLKPKTGTAPTGIFKEVKYIQRIATLGGKAPVQPPTSAVQTANVPYKAVYRFSK